MRRHGSIAAPPGEIPCPRFESVDTDLVAPRLYRFLLGLLWTISGALMAFNPPPPGGRRAHSLPVVGLVTMVGGIYFVVNALRTRDVKDTGKAPRHAPASARDAVKFFAGNAVMLAAGAGMLWWGIDSGQLSLVGLATAAIGLSVLAILLWLFYPGMR